MRTGHIKKLGWIVFEMCIIMTTASFALLLLT